MSTRKAGGTSTFGVRHDLEGLRAVAVLGVVIYHLRPGWLPGGFAGVDVFFVLSGFFITGLLLREIDRDGTVDLRRFWSRRARRLLPASALVLVSTVAAANWLTNPLETHRVARDGLFCAIFGMNWLEVHQGTQYLQDPHPSPLVHYWSLGVEEQFYLVWPVVLLVLVVFWRQTGHHRSLTPRRLLTWLGLAAALASFGLAVRQTHGQNPLAYFGTPERIWQLAVGGMLAAATARAPRLATVPAAVAAARMASRWLGVALVVGFYVLAGANIVYPGWYALVPTAGAALIVSAGEPIRGRGRTWDPCLAFLCSRPAQLGGRYSYSWYLWHYPPLVLLPIYLDRPLRIRELALVGLATFLAAVLTYHLLENPVRTSRWLAYRHGGRSIALGAALIATVVAAAELSATSAGYATRHAQITDASGTPLDPQPAAAAAQYPKPFTDGCMEATNVSHLAFECRYRPDTGHGDVIEVGDSHAASWWQAIESIASKHDWGLRLWGRTSCPFADVTKDIGRGPFTACDAWRADVVKRLVQAHPSLVIVTSLDTALPAFYRRDASGRPTSQHVSGQEGRAVWAQGMAANLKILKDAGIPVLLIHDTPGYPKAMTGPDCVLAHPRDVAACSLPQAQALPGAPNDLQAAREVGGISTIDFTRVFCHGGRCYQVIGSTLAYRDYNHLTSQITMRLEPMLDRAAVAAMTRVVSVVVPALH